jgi:hypothetical protein
MGMGGSSGLFWVRREGFREPTIVQEGRDDRKDRIREDLT